ncbi:MAG: serine protease [Prevotella sp.]|nr:serine protease [Prevotella sp.]
MYYRLTYIASSDKERLEDSVCNGNKPLSIGQGVSCNVQLPESDVYEPQIYAIILQNEDGDGWYVVRRTDSHHVLLNDVEVSVAQMLQSGDKLSFNDGTALAELKFETFDDGEYDASSGIVYKTHQSNIRFYIATLILALVALGVAIYGILSPRQADLRHTDLKPFCQSVYHVTVDSVYLLCDGIVVDSIELSNSAEGTAFLTDDSLFVTARHCIEPWVNDNDWDGVSSKLKMSPELRLATKAETENRMVGYEKYKLSAHCIISKGLERYSYYSTDFCMNKSRDMVIRLGTTKDVIYWRTIFPLAKRRDMELGDFAYIKERYFSGDVNKSQISMANWEDLVAFAKSTNHDIAFIGYPLNDNSTDSAIVDFGSLTLFEYNDNLPVGCLQFSANINPGNSGGPIFAMIDNKVKVIGIVSKADNHAKLGLHWAVPITEVLTMHKNGDKVEEDSVIYRR